MNKIIKTVGLLNDHGLLAFTALMFAASVTSVCLYFYGSDFDFCILTALLCGVIGMWNVADVQWMDKISVMKSEVADLKDKLCLAEHDADSLRLELETTQAALMEAQKRASSRMSAARGEQPTACVNVEFAESSDKDTEKQKAEPVRKAQNRKPVVKRKPKTENKE